MKKDNFEKIIGYENIKKELRLVADIIKNPAKYEKLGAKAPAGIMLVGPPGTGKSTIAEAFLKECECETIVLRKTKASDKLVFSMNSAFDKAKTHEGYTVILLDDFDKFENNDHREVNADCFVGLQSQIDRAKQEGTKVVVILTVNDVSGLPDSLKRRGRIDMRLKIGKPSIEDAKAIIKYYLKGKNCKDLDIDAIVGILNGSNCATLEAIMNNAAIIAARDGKEFITMDEINRAALRNIFGGPELPKGYSKKELHRIAVHEAGHAVIAEVLNPGRVNLIALTRTEGNGPGGVTNYYYGGACPNITTIEGFEERILQSLGGRAATEIVFGRVDTGTSSDLRKVNRMLWQLAEDECVWGFDTHVVEYDASAELEERIEKLVAVKTDKYYKDAIRILVENREFLDALIAELEKKIVVTREDIEKIMKKEGK